VAKQKRQVFHSILREKDGWVVLLEKQVVSKQDTQKEAEQAAIEGARIAFKDGWPGSFTQNRRRDPRRAYLQQGP
jgi:hypothetical protein